MSTDSIQRQAPIAFSTTPEIIEPMQLQYLIQDPSVTLSYTGISPLETIHLEGNIENGPKDNDIRVTGNFAIKKDGKFQYFNEVKEMGTAKGKEFDSIHTYTVARLVLNTYLEIFAKINVEENDLNEYRKYAFRKKWNGPLIIYPNAFKKRSSNYTPIDNYIDLGYDEEVGVCRSFDVVAHEVGHAIFQAIRYPYGTKISDLHTSPELDEAFADLTAVFALLDIKKVCDIVLDLTEFDLRSPINFIPKIGELLANSKDSYKPSTVRNISDVQNHIQLFIQQINLDPHTNSTILSGAIYEFIVRLYNIKKDEISNVLASKNRDEKIEILSTELYAIGQSVSVIVTNAFYNKRKSINLNMNSIGKEMLDLMLSSNTTYYSVFYKVFKDFNQFKLYPI